MESYRRHAMPAFVFVSLTELVGSLTIKAAENTPGKDENTYFTSKYVSQFSYTSSLFM